MITAGDFRKGVTFEYESGIYTIVEFQHVKPGKGAAFVRTTMKNVVSGKVLEKTWNPTEKVQEAQIETRNMTYSYTDGELYYFMDQETFDQIPLNKSQVEDALNFMTENMIATIQFYKGSAFSVVPPTFVELTITDCEPWIQGDTSKAGYKPATLETGYVLNVPLFVNSGERIRVDTRDGSYMERVK